MQRIARNESDCPEIFHHAKTEFGVDWNRCCDIFHRTEFMNQERKPTDFVLSELEENLQRNHPFWQNPDVQLAAQVIISFMKKNGVTEMRVNYD